MSSTVMGRVMRRAVPALLLAGRGSFFRALAVDETGIGPASEVALARPWSPRTRVSGR
jgi:hypothetical protein